MAVWDVLQALRRCWPVALGGLLVTALLAAYVHHEPDVYLAEADVYFVPPVGTSAGQAAIAMAGLVKTALETGGDHATVSPDVTLVDVGVYDGEEVQLPNSGGQWVNSFAEPVLRVSTTAPTAARSTARLGSLVDRIRRELDRVQHGVATDRRIWTRQIPDLPAADRETGHPAAATGVTVLLGLAGTCLLGVTADRWSRRWRARSARRPVLSGPRPLP